MLFPLFLTAACTYKDTRIIFCSALETIWTFKAKCSALYSEQMQIDSYTDNIISGMLMVDFSRLVRLYQRTVETAPSAHQTEIYKNLISYLMENLNTVTLHDVAEQMNYSTAYCFPVYQKTDRFQFHKSASIPSLQPGVHNAWKLEI